MKYFKAGITAIFVVTVSGCSWFSSITEGGESETIKLLGGYRTTGAADAVLGSYGIRLTYGKNKYQRVDVPKWSNVTTRKVAVISIQKNDEAKIEEFGISIPLIANIQNDASITQSEGYKIVFLQINSLKVLRSELKLMMKSDSDLAADIKDPQTRIIRTVGMVFDHTLTKSFEGGTSGDITLVNTGGSPKIKFKVSGGADKTVELGNETVVAYQFVRACWTVDGDLRQLVEDQVGVDSFACPNGSHFKHPDFRK